MNFCTLFAGLQGKHAFVALLVVEDERKMIATLLSLFPHSVLKRKLTYKVRCNDQVFGTIVAAWNHRSISTCLEPTRHGIVIFVINAINHVLELLQITHVHLTQQLLGCSFQTLLGLCGGHICRSAATARIITSSARVLCATTRILCTWDIRIITATARHHGKGHCHSQKRYQ